MKKYFLNAPQKPEVNDLAKMAEMVLDRALRDFQKKRILKEIDQTLMNGNKKEFLRLTEELQKYLE